MKKITPFLWFDKEAQEAAQYYVSIFQNSSVTMTSPMMTTFSLDGQEYMALNGGPGHPFTDAISMFVTCEDQKEVDFYWEKLSADPASEQCGWCKDKYGLYWQIIPKQFMELVQDTDPVKSKAVMDAMLKVKKLNVAELQAAYDGK